MKRTLLCLLLVLAGCDGMAPEAAPPEEPALDDSLEALITLSGQRRLSNFVLPESDDLSAIPQDPANPLTPEKVVLGRLLFHETGLATDPRRPEGRGTYACATCHYAGAGFRSARRQAIGEGGVGWGRRGEGRAPDPAYGPADLDVQPLRTPSVLNSAYQRLMLWDGSLGAHGPNAGTEARWTAGTSAGVNALGYDGLETQAIAGLTVHRMGNLSASPLARDYAALWEAAFPGTPFSLENAGLAIAAYERTLLADRAPLQRWLRGERTALTPAEKRGALLFFGKAGCATCHTGPALNQMAFYALGMPDLQGPDVLGVVPESRGRGAFLGDAAEDFKFKVPGLYNLKDAPFYGHGGAFETLREVVEYYNAGVPARPLPEGRLVSRFRPLGLTPAEVDDLVTFLSEALYDPDLMRYVPDALPSGQCTPANDTRSRADLGCR